MELVEEIDFLINASKKHEESGNTEDFIRSVEKLYNRGSISSEALKMAKKLFPSKSDIVREAKKQLLSNAKKGAQQEDDSSCGSGRSYTRSSC